MSNVSQFANVHALFEQMEPDAAPSKILAGDPKTFAAELADAEKLNAGVWSSTVGSWEIESWSVNEVMLIHSGKVRLTGIDGEVTLLGPGDAFFVAKGWQGTWETLEPVKKFYVIVY